MQVVTDEQRREVAERLRGLRRDAHNVTQLNHGPTWSLAWCVLGDGLDECGTGDWFERMCARLADLIEPDTTSDTTKSAEDTTKAPTSSDTASTSSGAAPTHTDATATFDVSQGRRDTVACDRDALLALAEDVDGAADDSGGFEPLAGMLRDIARSIREALGVTDG